jgi:hypothetical protein
MALQTGAESWWLSPEAFTEIVVVVMAVVPVRLRGVIRTLSH